MFYIIFIISALILFAAFNMVYNLPKMPSRHANDYEGYFMEVAERIASIKDPKHINTAEHVKMHFENKYKAHPMVRKDSELLQLQIEGKKRRLSGGTWLCILFLLSLNVNAQYLGVSVINKGIGVNAGILSNKLNVQAALTFPINNLENATTYSLTTGYQINLTNDDADNYSFTPSIGGALIRTTIFSDKAPKLLQQNIVPIYGVEVGKDAYMGRVFINANYSNALYYGLGMKVFFNR